MYIFVDIFLFILDYNFDTPNMRLQSQMRRKIRLKKKRRKKR